MKRIKMVLYGEPGVGKSVFASKFPKPFFITTDGNYEWLVDFGAKEEDHARVSSWSEAKKVFKRNFDNYETIVIDLTEDLFKWCEQDYCIKEGIAHISDAGFGKGYDISRNDFFLEVCKLINLDKHIVFLMHGYSAIEKNRQGVEKTMYRPTNRLPDKVLDMIEGRVRYFLRCYLQGEPNEEGIMIKKRYLSLIPKENEVYAICRGINEAAVPHDIPLDFNIFAETIGLYNTPQTNSEIKHLTKVNVEKVKFDNEEKVDVIAFTDESNSKELNKTVEDTQQEVQQELVKPKVETNEEKLARIRAKLNKKLGE